MTRSFFAKRSLGALRSLLPLVLACSSRPNQVKPPAIDFVDLECATHDGTASCRELKGGGLACCATQADGTDASWLCPREAPFEMRPTQGAQEVPGLVGAVEIEVGRRHACARMFDGTVRCFGSYSGELGQGAGQCQVSPAALTIRDAAEVVSLAGTCALVRNGTVSCWGQNSNVPRISGARQVEGSCAVLDSGRVACWATTADPTLEALYDVDELRLDESGGCARIHDHVRCWGYNYEGEVGDGSVDPRPASSALDTTPAVKRRPTVVPGIDRPTQIAAGSGSRCALIDGVAWCWGRGFGPKPSPVEGLPPLRRLSLGASRVCAIADDRTVWCWGAEPPRRLDAFGTVVSLSSGGLGLCAVNDQGRVRCQGSVFAPDTSISGTPHEGVPVAWSDEDLLPTLPRERAPLRCEHVTQYCLESEARLSCFPDEDACLDSRSSSKQSEICVERIELTFVQGTERCTCRGDACTQHARPCVVTDPTTELEVDSSGFSSLCSRYRSSTTKAPASTQRVRYCTQTTHEEPRACPCPQGGSCSCGTEQRKQRLCARSIEECEAARETILGAPGGAAEPCERSS